MKILSRDKGRCRRDEPDVGGGHVFLEIDDSFRQSERGQERIAGGVSRDAIEAEGADGRITEQRLNDRCMEGGDEEGGVHISRTEG